MTLSEKIKGAFGIEHCMKEDVKFFIKELKDFKKNRIIRNKDMIQNGGQCYETKQLAINLIEFDKQELEEIDKLAGEEFVK